MKAKEYYEKYKDQFSREQSKEDFAFVTSKLYEELYMEGYDIINARKCKSDKAALAVIHEQNDKANAIMRIFEKDTGAAPLVMNWFLKVVSDHIGIDCSKR